MNELHLPFFGALRAVGNGAVFSALTPPSSYHLGSDWVATGASRLLDFPTLKAEEKKFPNIFCLGSALISCGI